LCRNAGLSNEDMDDMTIGMCLDFVYVQIDMKNPKKQSTRQATQTDFDRF